MKYLLLEKNIKICWIVWIWRDLVDDSSPLRETAWNPELGIGCVPNHVEVFLHLLHLPLVHFLLPWIHDAKVCGLFVRSRDVRGQSDGKRILETERMMNERRERESLILWILCFGPSSIFQFSRPTPEIIFVIEVLPSLQFYKYIFQFSFSYSFIFLI